MNTRNGAANLAGIGLESSAAEHMAAGDRLLRAEDLAESWQVPATWIRAEARAGRLPSVKLGHYRRFLQADADAFIAQLRSGR